MKTIVEVTLKNSPTGQRMLTKPYPKDNEPRTLGLPPDLLTQLADSITQRVAAYDVLSCSLAGLSYGVGCGDSA